MTQRQAKDRHQLTVFNKLFQNQVVSVLAPQGGFLTLFMADMESSRRIEENNFPDLLPT